MRKPRADRPRTAGFTLIELLVVVLIIGILASIAVPQYFKVVEKGRFAETTSCFQVLKGAQSRYLLKWNSYTNLAADLDVTCATLKYYNAPTMTATSSTFTARIRRKAPTPAVYGGYTVTYRGPAGTLTCSQTNCSSDLLP